jgi:hypothetical protein
MCLPTANNQTFNGGLIIIHCVMPFFLIFFLLQILTFFFKWQENPKKHTF